MVLQDAEIRVAPLLFPVDDFRRRSACDLLVAEAEAEDRDIEIEDLPVVGRVLSL